MYSTTTHIHSDRQEYKNIEDTHFDSNREISPYRVENFIEMLHNFGISDSTIKKKIINSPLGHGLPRQEGSIESMISSSSPIKNVIPQGKLLEKSETANNKIAGWRIVSFQVKHVA